MAKSITKKAMTVAGAAVLTGALLIGGTFAWQAISPAALNENRALLNAGGRLHDDYNGSTKNVYVENFTEESGGGPIIVRVRLDEYMEIGASAGDKDTEESTTKTARSLVEGSTILNRNSWKTYKPWTATDGKLTVNEESPFRTYIDLTFGSDDTIYYMPTFDKNVDSLASDVNGTYTGPDGDYEDADDAFKDYVNWTQIQSDGAKYNGLDSTIAETITVTKDDEGNTVVTQEKDAVYDADDDTTDEGDAATTNDVTKVKEIHTLKPIDKSKSVVISMKQWTTEGSGYYLQTGDFWVYDEDGWAYWANLLAPGETTGLLLSENKSNGKEKENWYYGMNVVGEFVTASDLGKGEGTGFYTDPKKEPTTDAEILLSLLGAGDQITGGTVDENGVLQLTSGNTHTLSIDAVGSVATTAESETTISAGWTVADSSTLDGSENDVIVLTNTGNGTAEIKAEAPGEATLVYIADGVTAAVKVHVGYATYTIETDNLESDITKSIVTYSSDKDGNENAAIEIDGYYTDMVNKVWYQVAIGDGVFKRKTGLTNVILNDGVSSIGEEAFYNCTGLRNIDIPDTVTTIGQKAFYKCGQLEDIEIPESVNYIGREAFNGCSTFTSIDIPVNVTYIGGAAFCGNIGVEKINIDENNQNYCVDEYGVLYNKDRTKIISYPAGSTETSYTVPGSVSSIESCIFTRSTNLKKLEFSEGISVISTYVCSGCTALESVTIPSSLNYIGNNSFANCTNLKDVYYAGTEEQWNEIDIITGNDYLKNATIHYNQQ